MVRGDRSDLDNLFRWDNIRLNLPGDPNYPPKIPWVSKVPGGTQDLDAYFTTYVDDSRGATGSAEEVWRADWRVGSIWKYLGLKDDPRKRRTVDQEGGLWRGTKVHIIYGYIYQLIGE